MFGSTRLAAVWCGACYLASAAVPSTPWLVARTSAFEVFTDAGPQTARSTLLWFEELRAFFTRQTGLAITAGPPVRVIVFRSTQEYSEFRPRPEASAFYAGMGAGNYVVMEQSGVNWPGIAAHEYAHCLMHANGVAFPAWLSEGLAEVFSTVRIGEHASTIGSALPSRLQTLGRGDWIPLPALLSTPDDTNAGNRFYAQSWALAHMLVFSPEYSRFFPALIASGGALSQSCGKPLDAIARDLRAWVDTPSHFQPITLGGLTAPDISIQTAELSSFERRRVLADLLLTSTEFARAAAMYEELRREAPADKEVIAALGEIAVHNGDRPAALRAWKQAVDLGTRDPKLCMRYVALAQQAGAPETEIRPVLERVLALDPAYDDARYQLALIDINTGDFDG
ncbi:MAG TPA: hypothetical protein VFA04_01355, partial [Bryobacteraceae bacterium]|nr:hypothetical protein [Bryobacteraceae bacterium]